MTTSGLRNKFAIELDKISVGSYDTFVNEEIDYFISFGIRQFYSRRLAGSTQDRTSFEEWQKRSDDMRGIYASATLSPVESGIKKGLKWSKYKLPSNYWHMLSEDAAMVSSTEFKEDKDFTRYFDIFECTTDNFTARVRDSLGPHIYDKKYIRPLRLYSFENNQSLTPPGSLSPVKDAFSNLYYSSPSDVYLTSYVIEYFKRPEGFGIYSDGYREDFFNDDMEIHQVPEHAWDEVISISVKHALENTSSYRIQTYGQEKVEIQ